MEAKAIETHYNGYRFRSRLEARWAVFFDAADINYQYEPEGISFHGEKYLPDFYLPSASNYGCYVEVKPNIRTRYPEIGKAARVTCMGAGYPLVVLSEVPLIKDCGIWCFPMFGYDQIEGEICVELVPMITQGEQFFFHQGLALSRNTRTTLYAFLGGHWDYSLAGMSCKQLEHNGHYCFWETESADDLELSKYIYNKARSARFEFGENG